MTTQKTTSKFNLLITVSYIHKQSLHTKISTPFVDSNIADLMLFTSNQQ